MFKQRVKSNGIFSEYISDCVSPEYPVMDEHKLGRVFRVIIERAKNRLI